MDGNGEFDERVFRGSLQKIQPDSIIRYPSSRPAALIAGKYGLTGVNRTVTSACASATQAIGLAYRHIQEERADLMVCGGADSMIHPVGLVYFVLLTAAATTRAEPETVCRPFDGKRRGLVIGEGAGVVILEAFEHALERKAPIYGELAGYGTAMDAYQVTAPHPDGRGLVEAMKGAIEDGGVSPREIGYINAHGTGTRLNDLAETRAIKTLFGAGAGKIPISSSKSMIGHLMAAAGGPELIYTVLTVARGEIHPTVNLTHPDPACDLDFVPRRKRRARMSYALTNSVGFGGQNASLLIRAWPPGEEIHNENPGRNGSRE
jgi:3-oxoacyl-[acyl-carrier-protein] synthase II